MSKGPGDSLHHGVLNCVSLRGRGTGLPPCSSLPLSHTPPGPPSHPGVSHRARVSKCVCPSYIHPFSSRVQLFSSLMDTAASLAFNETNVNRRFHRVYNLSINVNMDCSDGGAKWMMGARRNEGGRGGGGDNQFGQIVSALLTYSSSHE